MGRGGYETKLVRRIAINSLSDDIVESIGLGRDSRCLEVGNKRGGGFGGDCDRCHCREIVSGKQFVKRCLGY
jgi:hypothetical protein